MPIGSESSVAPLANQSCSASVERAVSHFCLSRRAFTPWAPWLIGLALVVAIWASGYKLSRYYPNLDTVSRTSFVKLWDKHDDSAHAVQTVNTVPPAHLPPGLHVIVPAYQEPSELEYSGLLDLNEGKPISTSFYSVIPLRSPPSQIL